MAFLKDLQLFIQKTLREPEKSVFLYGVEESQWNFLRKKIQLGLPSSCHLLLFDSSEKAEYYHNQWEETSSERTFFYPGLDSSPYGGHFHSDFSLFERFQVLSFLILRENETRCIIFSSVDAVVLFVPPPSFFEQHQYDFEISDIIPPRELAKKLISLGFLPSVSTEERGTFSMKGEIFDLYPLNGPPLRIHYFDDMIEEIFAINLENQRTQRDISYQNIRLFPVPPLFAQPQFSKNLRHHLPRFSSDQKEKNFTRENILSKLNNNDLFDSYSLFCPLFVKKPVTLLDFLDPQKDIIHLFNSENYKELFSIFSSELETEYQNILEEKENPCIFPPPNHFYNFKIQECLEKFHRLYINLFLNRSNKKNSVTLSLEDSISYLIKNCPTIFKENKNSNKLSCIIQAISKCQEEGKKITIVYSHESTKKELQSFLHENINIHFQKDFLEKGFFLPQENIIVLSELDFFKKRKKVSNFKKQRQNIDLFAEQITQLNIDDYVVHKNHGVGIYKGLQTIEIGDNKNDFVVIQYQDDDKIYLPVHRIGLIQKYQDSSTNVTIASLKNNKFYKTKARSKESAKKLALDLIKIQAKRNKKKPHQFFPPDNLFKEFEQKCPFRETDDQISAIENVLDDMQKEFPMDRLICGDVGFGKTEVAMRAAFKAVEDKMQVAIIVPTTILALQHYKSFQKRFNGFAVNIDFISRFKSLKETKEIIKKTQSGEIDILIGTHKILSSKIKFKDIGLLIIDEEQRFGVSHKEKIKEIKSSIDVLTLTATPIPRTLQLVFLNIRSVSLIQTPPPKRQSIKSYVLKENHDVIKKAIQNELKRGGQIFVIYNRVRDIEQVASRIRELVPSIKMTIAHGQMPEKDLEQKMNDFYNQKYDLLLSTTIVESGLDLPNANTMIIYRADMYGLSQLHQLRGRIGRSDRKAYAYFLTPKEYAISHIASQRLKNLQIYSEIGSGFSIASSDLEIRGAGDILGAEQSGHIEAVGLEIYMELLKEAISELEGKKLPPPKNIEIQTPFSCFIPESYIADSRERLKIYKRFANIEDDNSLQAIQEELEDRFGLPPKELKQLFILLSIQILVRPLGIKKVNVSYKTIELTFSKEYLETNPEHQKKIVAFFISQNSGFKFSSQHSVTRLFSSTITMEKLFSFSKEVAQNFIT